MKSIHPFEPFIPSGADKLIIGSIPPPRFCFQNRGLFIQDVNFYYGSKDNEFWPIFERIFELNFEYENSEKAVNQRKDLLNKLKIGITDIVEKCYHNNDSAADEDLREIEYKNINDLLLKYPGIETLIYTSEFVKSQMNSIFRTYHSISKENRRIQSIIIEGKKYNVKILYSPSPNALRNLGENGKKRREQQYREFLKN